jgi:uncharacterized protein
LPFADIWKLAPTLRCKVFSNEEKKVLRVKFISVLLYILVFAAGGASMTIQGCKSSVTNKATTQPSAQPEIGRTTDDIRRNGNHLINEKSLYLQQHAHNPVDWYPWSSQALDRAHNEDKPIFLSIGYSACHWCHVMETEVFENDEIAAFLNANFISIKVDREERPDLDKAYMDAVLAITGSGGWPMSVFLTPDQKPFFGGTYFPREQFSLLTARLLEAYNNERELVVSQAEKLYEHVSAELQIEPEPIQAELFGQAVAIVKKRIDHKWGGFTAQMKFPMPVSWQFLLRYLRKQADPELEKIIRLTLDRMASGGLQDHLAGGFYRYCTEPTWLIPHFEKMLYDNALLANLYLEAAVGFEDKNYAGIGRATLDFMINEMSDQTGGFYSSYDADSGGEEGAFYLWTPAEIVEVAGKQDGLLLSALLGVTPEGNFEGKSILTLRNSPAELAKQFGRDEDQGAGLLSRHKQAMLAYRQKRVAPGLDRKIITSWNGLAISALAQAYRTLGDESYLEAGEKAAAYLLSVHRRPNGGLFRSSNNKIAEHNAILDDYAFLARGLLDLYQTTGKQDYLKSALELIDYTIKNFSNPKGGFYLTAVDQKAPLGRQFEVIDGVRPSGNAIMLEALLVAGTITGREQYKQLLQTTLEAYARALRAAGLEMAGWLDVALRQKGPFYNVVIAGDLEASDTQRLVSGIQRLNPAGVALAFGPAGDPSAEMLQLIPSLAGKKAMQGKPTAFVCKHGVCKQPTHDAEVLERQVLNGWNK